MTENEKAGAHRYLTTSEVAAYLRMKERKVYDLVRQGLIPSTKVTGKLLFPRDSVDLWVMNHLEGDQAPRHTAPPVLAGSQDPLLDWAVREAGADLAFLCNGSGDGVRRLLRDEATVAGLHVIDHATGNFNDPAHLGLSGMRDLVIIHWARRTQGLLVKPANPHGIRDLADLASPAVRVAHRQRGAGSDALFRSLLEHLEITASELNLAPYASLSEDDLALSIREGEADTGLAVEAAARRHGLDFIPLHQEVFDLAMRRRVYFEPQVQRLMTFARSERLHARAESMGGYDISHLGEIRFNA
ncbi:helix-turn-helix transcriptional regulator [Franzmannia qiaohouensis]|uniref:Helix-turn-helix transcriptional regulator n=1 Tax=Franzmannia qiaohouensis TaxID=1329370 RepID=A0ABU1HDL1_9GAMM|nr:helix-turn-helix transcriptional regulator [Halomonas qiaohouensis]MDR5904924.1 helix-turn-helix transcriptional regulator [Halomonas qiaohouensis]